MFRRVENQEIWARSTFHGWVLRSLGGFGEEGVGGGSTVGKKCLNPSPPVALVI
jgi:hypothetical protein